MTSTDRRSALAALTIAGVLFGLTVPLSKLALGWLDPATLTVVRFGVAAPLLAAVALLGRRSLRAAVSGPILAWGALGYGGMILLQNLGVERTSVTHAALVFGAVPALVAVVAVVVGRGTAGPRAWTGYGAALVGVALVAGAGGDASLAGDALVLGSAILSAAFVVAQTRLLQGRDPVAVTAWQMAAAAVVVLPVAALAGEPATLAGAVPGAEAAAVLALVLAGTLLPFALYAFGQARVPAEVAGAFVNLEPLVGVGAGVVAFGNALGPAQALGALAVVGGILLSLTPAPRARGAGRRGTEPAVAAAG